MKFENRKVMLTETILRDAHQSQAATRMRIEEMLPVLEQLDDIGYYSIEAWGGATFDSCLRFLNEDPWERLRTLKAHLKTPIQMLLRGQNLLGYRHYADDVVENFVEKSVANGIDIIRIFDCFNDLRNLQCAVNAANEIKKREGRGEAQIALSYTLGDAYTLDYWMDMAKNLLTSSKRLLTDSILIRQWPVLMLSRIMRTDLEWWIGQLTMLRIILPDIL